MSEPNRSGSGGGAGETHRYETSGIEERTGRVPAWLAAVIILLLIWMVYYLIHNWAPPA